MATITFGRVAEQEYSLPLTGTEFDYTQANVTAQSFGVFTLQPWQVLDQVHVFNQGGTVAGPSLTAFNVNVGTVLTATNIGTAGTGARAASVVAGTGTPTTISVSFAPVGCNWSALTTLPSNLVVRLTYIDLSTNGDNVR